MTKIDTSKWKEFKLDSIFFMNNTKSIVKEKIKPDSGTTPYVTAQAGANGVLTYIDCPPELKTKGKCIMIGGKTLTFSYQDRDFCSNDSHNIVLYLKDMTNVPVSCYLFLITALRSSLCHKYSWSDSISMKSIKRDTLCLPVSANDEDAPDWKYMGEYMSKVIIETEKDLNCLCSIGEKHSMDMSDWHEFTIGSLFDIFKGRRLTKADMIPGTIPFIGSSAMDNGRTAMVGNEEHIFKGNAISVCYNGSVGKAFYQENSFLASDDVNVLLPKFQMTRNIALFVIPLIESVGAGYNYTNKWTREKMATSKIRLPVDASGKPHWKYMDDYMNEEIEKAENVLAGLQSIG